MSLTTADMQQMIAAHLIL